MTPKKKFNVIFLFILLASSVCGDDSPLQLPSDPAQKDSPKKQAPGTARLIRKNQHGQSISNLELLETEVLVTLRQVKKKFWPFVTIYGKYDRPGWNLFLLDNQVRKPLLGLLPEKSSFRFFARLWSETSKVTLIAVSPEGVTETEDIFFQANKTKQYSLIPPSKWGKVFVSLGISNLSYFQSGYGDFTSKSGLVQIHYTGPQWNSGLGVLASIQETFLTLSSNPERLGPQILAGKLDLSFLLNYTAGIQNTSPFEPTFLFGMSYLTLLSNGSPFGFKNLLGPEIGLRVSYALKAHGTFSMDLRFVQLGSGLFSFQERGLELNLAYTWVIANNHPIETGFRISDTRYFPEDLAQIKTSLASFYFGYGI